MRVCILMKLTQTNWNQGVCSRTGSTWIWRKIGNLSIGGFFFSPKVLAVGIAVPWLENTNHILVYFLLMSNVSLFKNNKFETTSTDLVNKRRAIFIQTCLFVKDSHATSVGFFSSVLNKIHFLVNIFPFAVLKLQYIYIAY